MKILFVATVDLHIQTFHLRTIHQLHARGDIVDVCTNGTYTNEDIHHKYTLPFSRNPLSLSNLKAKKELRKILDELINLDANYKSGLIDLNIGLETILCRYCS